MRSDLTNCQLTGKCLTSLQHWEILLIPLLVAQMTYHPVHLQHSTVTCSGAALIALMSLTQNRFWPGRIRTIPSFLEDGRVVPSQVLPISWGADHRVLDGAALANFNVSWKALLENPQLLLMHLR